MIKTIEKKGQHLDNDLRRRIKVINSHGYSFSQEEIESYLESPELFSARLEKLVRNFDADDDLNNMGIFAELAILLQFSPTDSQVLDEIFDDIIDIFLITLEDSFCQTEDSAPLYNAALEIASPLTKLLNDHQKKKLKIGFLKVLDDSFIPKDIRTAMLTCLPDIEPNDKMRKVIIDKQKDINNEFEANMNEIRNKIEEKLSKNE